MGYSGLLWVIPGYYGVLSYRYKVGRPPTMWNYYLSNEDLTQCCFNVGPAPLAVGKY